MTTGPEEGKCARPDEGPDGIPLALRLSEGLGRLHVVSAKIRGTHHYSYRSGEWARVMGVVFVKPDPRLEIRPAYLVQYDDGETGHIALYDRENYELAPAA